MSERNIVLETIMERRTIRRYTDEAVDDETVRQVLLAAMSAPSTMGRRPWHFLVIREAEVKKLVAYALRLHPYVEQAPVLVAVLADQTVSPAWKLDLSAAVENALLAATSLGLGSAWIGAPDVALQEQAEAKLRQVMCMPDEVRLFAFFILGHSAEQRPPHQLDPYFVSTRVHYETWDGLRLSQS